ncbi:MAG: DNA polymerase III subunit chi [Proteobacteria bacterium]|nr:DNA polymerase III subunit chi [Pseudomonadota bacterium]
MTDVGFYHLTRSKLDGTLPKLLEKTLAAEKRALVIVGSDERMRWLDDLLWTYDPASWLPHGTAKDGDPEAQPVWIATTDDNPNGAHYLFLADGGGTGKISEFERCFDLFDGDDTDAVQAARQRWKALKEAGHELTYWQQNPAGGWEKKS